jgi:hypothetical protein
MLPLEFQESPHYRLESTTENIRFHIDGDQKTKSSVIQEVEIPPTRFAINH